MDDPRVISYLALRKAIGIIGYVLPLWLVLGEIYIYQDPGVRPSISDYYHHDPGMRDWLVGALCAIGVFLFSYKGYDNPNPNPAWQRLPFKGKDDLVSSLAGICAVGVAIFPTQEESTSAVELATSFPGLHVTFAAVFFFSLAYISAVRFTDHGPAPRDPETRDKAKQEKRWENRIYVGCGVVIVICLALIALVWLLPNDFPIRRINPVLVLEWVAIWAFSTSWFLKGSESLKRALRTIS